MNIKTLSACLADHQEVLSIQEAAILLEEINPEEHEHRLATDGNYAAHCSNYLDERIWEWVSRIYYAVAAKRIRHIDAGLPEDSWGWPSIRVHVRDLIEWLETIAEPAVSPEVSLSIPEGASSVGVGAAVGAAVGADVGVGTDVGVGVAATGCDGPGDSNVGGIDEVDDDMADGRSVRVTCIPGKLPRTSIGKLATHVAWQIEQETNRVATSAAVMEQLQAWADDGSKPDVLLNSKKANRAVIWRTKDGKTKQYDSEACGKTLSTWQKSRA